MHTSSKQRSTTQKRSKDNDITKSQSKNETISQTNTSNFSTTKPPKTTKVKTTLRPPRHTGAPPPSKYKIIAPKVDCSDGQFSNPHNTPAQIRAHVPLGSVKNIGDLPEIALRPENRPKTIPDVLNMLSNVQKGITDAAKGIKSNRRDTVQNLLSYRNKKGYYGIFGKQTDATEATLVIGRHEDLEMADRPPPSLLADLISFQNTQGQVRDDLLKFHEEKRLRELETQVALLQKQLQEAIAFTKLQSEFNQRSNDGSSNSNGSGGRSKGVGSNEDTALTLLSEDETFHFGSSFLKTEKKVTPQQQQQNTNRNTKNQDHDNYGDDNTSSNDNNLFGNLRKRNDEEEKKQQKQWENLSAAQSTQSWAQDFQKRQKLEEEGKSMDIGQALEQQDAVTKAFLAAEHKAQQLKEEKRQRSAQKQLEKKLNDISSSDQPTSTTTTTNDNDVSPINKTPLKTQDELDLEQLELWEQNQQVRAQNERDEIDNFQKNNQQQTNLKSKKISSNDIEDKGAIETIRTGLGDLDEELGMVNYLSEKKKRQEEEGEVKAQKKKAATPASENHLFADDQIFFDGSTPANNDKLRQDIYQNKNKRNGLWGEDNESEDARFDQLGLDGDIYTEDEIKDDDDDDDNDNKDEQQVELDEDGQPIETNTNQKAHLEEVHRDPVAVHEFRNLPSWLQNTFLIPPKYKDGNMLIPESVPETLRKSYFFHHYHLKRDKELLTTHTYGHDISTGLASDHVTEARWRGREQNYKTREKEHHQMNQQLAEEIGESDYHSLLMQKLQAPAEADQLSLATRTQEEKNVDVAAKADEDEGEYEYVYDFEGDWTKPIRRKKKAPGQEDDELEADQDVLSPTSLDLLATSPLLQSFRTLSAHATDRQNREKLKKLDHNWVEQDEFIKQSELYDKALATSYSTPDLKRHLRRLAISPVERYRLDIEGIQEEIENENWASAAMILVDASHDLAITQHHYTFFFQMIKKSAEELESSPTWALKQSRMVSAVKGVIQRLVAYSLAVKPTENDDNLPNFLDNLSQFDGSPQSLQKGVLPPRKGHPDKPVNPLHAMGLISENHTKEPKLSDEQGYLAQNITRSKKEQSYQNNPVGDLTPELTTQITATLYALQAPALLSDFNTQLVSVFATKLLSWRTQIVPSLFERYESVPTMTPFERNIFAVQCDLVIELETFLRDLLLIHTSTSVLTDPKKLASHVDSNWPEQLLFGETMHEMNGLLDARREMLLEDPPTNDKYKWFASYHATAQARTRAYLQGMKNERAMGRMSKDKAKLKLWDKESLSKPQPEPWKRPSKFQYLVYSREHLANAPPIDPYLDTTRLLTPLPGFDYVPPPTSTNHNKESFDSNGNPIVTASYLKKIHHEEDNDDLSVISFRRPYSENFIVPYSRHAIYKKKSIAIDTTTKVEAYTIAHNTDGSLSAFSLISQFFLPGTLPLPILTLNRVLNLFKDEYSQDSQVWAALPFNLLKLLPTQQSLQTTVLSSLNYRYVPDYNDRQDSRQFNALIKKEQRESDIAEARRTDNRSFQGFKQSGENENGFSFDHLNETSQLNPDQQLTATSLQHIQQRQQESFVTQSGLGWYNQLYFDQLPTTPAIENAIMTMNAKKAALYTSFQPSTTFSTSFVTPTAIHTTNNSAIHSPYPGIVPTMPSIPLSTLILNLNAHCVDARNALDALIQLGKNNVNKAADIKTRQKQSNNGANGDSINFTSMRDQLDAIYNSRPGLLPPSLSPIHVSRYLHTLTKSIIPLSYLDTYYGNEQIKQIIGQEAFASRIDHLFDIVDGVHPEYQIPHVQVDVDGESLGPSQNALLGLDYWPFKHRTRRIKDRSGVTLDDPAFENNLLGLQRVGRSTRFETRYKALSPYANPRVGQRERILSLENYLDACVYDSPEDRSRKLFLKHRNKTLLLGILTSFCVLLDSEFEYSNESKKIAKKTGIYGESYDPEADGGDDEVDEQEQGLDEDNNGDKKKNDNKKKSSTNHNHDASDRQLYDEFGQLKQNLDDIDSAFDLDLDFENDAGEQQQTVSTNTKTKEKKSSRKSKKSSKNIYRPLSSTPHLSTALLNNLVEALLRCDQPALAYSILEFQNNGNTPPVDPNSPKPPRHSNSTEWFYWFRQQVSELVSTLQEQDSANNARLLSPNVSRHWDDVSTPLIPTNSLNFTPIQNIAPIKDSSNGDKSQLSVVQSPPKLAIPRSNTDMIDSNYLTQLFAAVTAAKGSKSTNLGELLTEYGTQYYNDGDEIYDLSTGRIVALESDRYRHYDHLPNVSTAHLTHSRTTRYRLLPTQIRGYFEEHWLRNRAANLITPEPNENGDLIEIDTTAINLRKSPLYKEFLNETKVLFNSSLMVNPLTMDLDQITNISTRPHDLKGMTRLQGRFHLIKAIYRFKEYSGEKLHTNKFVQNINQLTQNDVEDATSIVGFIPFGFMSAMLEAPTDPSKASSTTTTTNPSSSSPNSLLPLPHRSTTKPVLLKPNLTTYELLLGYAAANQDVSLTLQAHTLLFNSKLIQNVYSSTTMYNFSQQGGSGVGVKKGSYGSNSNNDNEETGEQSTLQSNTTKSIDYLLTPLRLTNFAANAMLSLLRVPLSSHYSFHMPGNINQMADGLLENYPMRYPKIIHQSKEKKIAKRLARKQGKLNKTKKEKKTVSKQHQSPTHLANSKEFQASAVGALLGEEQATVFSGENSFTRNNSKRAALGQNYGDDINGYHVALELFVSPSDQNTPNDSSSSNNIKKKKYFKTRAELHRVIGNLIFEKNIENLTTIDPITNEVIHPPTPQINFEKLFVRPIFHDNVSSLDPALGTALPQQFTNQGTSLSTQNHMSTQTLSDHINLLWQAYNTLSIASPFTQPHSTQVVTPTLQLAMASLCASLGDIQGLVRVFNHIEYTKTLVYCASWMPHLLVQAYTQFLHNKRLDDELGEYYDAIAGIETPEYDNSKMPDGLNTDENFIASMMGREQLNLDENGAPIMRNNDQPKKSKKVKEYNALHHEYFNTVYNYRNNVQYLSNEMYNQINLLRMCQADPNWQLACVSDYYHLDHYDGLDKNNNLEQQDGSGIVENTDAANENKKTIGFTHDKRKKSRRSRSSSALKLLHSLGIDSNSNNGKDNENGLGMMGSNTNDDSATNNHTAIREYTGGVNASNLYTYFTTMLSQTTSALPTLPPSFALDLEHQFKQISNEGKSQGSALPSSSSTTPTSPTTNTTNNTTTFGLTTPSANSVTSQGDSKLNDPHVQQQQMKLSLFKLRKRFNLRSFSWQQVTAQLARGNSNLKTALFEMIVERQHDDALKLKDRQKAQLRSSVNLNKKYGRPTDRKNLLEMQRGVVDMGLDEDMMGQYQAFLTKKVNIGTHNHNRQQEDTLNFEFPLHDTTTAVANQSNDNTTSNQTDSNDNDDYYSSYDPQTASYQYKPGEDDTFYYGAEVNDDKDDNDYYSSSNSNTITDAQYANGSTPYKTQQQQQHDNPLQPKPTDINQQTHNPNSINLFSKRRLDVFATHIRNQTAQMVLPALFQVVYNPRVPHTSQGLYSDSLPNTTSSVWHTTRFESIPELRRTMQRILRQKARMSDLLRSFTAQFYHYGLSPYMGMNKSGLSLQYDYQKANSALASPLSGLVSLGSGLGLNVGGDEDIYRHKSSRNAQSMNNSVDASSGQLIEKLSLHHQPAGDGSSSRRYTPQDIITTCFNDLTHLYSITLQHFSLHYKHKAKPVNTLSSLVHLKAPGFQNELLHKLVWLAAPVLRSDTDLTSSSTKSLRNDNNDDLIADANDASDNDDDEGDENDDSSDVEPQLPDIFESTTGPVPQPTQMIRKPAHSHLASKDLTAAILSRYYINHGDRSEGSPLARGSQYLNGAIQEAQQRHKMKEEHNATSLHQLEQNNVIAHAKANKTGDDDEIAEEVNRFFQTEVPNLQTFGLDEKTHNQLVKMKIIPDDAKSNTKVNPTALAQTFFGTRAFSHYQRGLLHAETSGHSFIQISTAKSEDFKPFEVLSGIRRLFHAEREETRRLYSSIGDILPPFQPEVYMIEHYNLCHTPNSSHIYRPLTPSLFAPEPGEAIPKLHSYVTQPEVFTNAYRDFLMKRVPGLRLNGFSLTATPAVNNKAVALDGDGFAVGQDNGPAIPNTPVAPSFSLDRRDGTMAEQQRRHLGLRRDQKSNDLFVTPQDEANCVNPSLLQAEIEAMSLNIRAGKAIDVGMVVNTASMYAFLGDFPSMVKILTQLYFHSDDLLLPNMTSVRHRLIAPQFTTNQGRGIAGNVGRNPHRRVGAWASRALEKADVTLNISDHTFLNHGADEAQDQSGGNPDDPFGWGSAEQPPTTLGQTPEDPLSADIINPWETPKEERDPRDLREHFNDDKREDAPINPRLVPQYQLQVKYERLPFKTKQFLDLLHTISLHCHLTSFLQSIPNIMMLTGQQQGVDFYDTVQSVSPMAPSFPLVPRDVDVEHQTFMKEYSQQKKTPNKKDKKTLELLPTQQVQVDLFEHTTARLFKEVQLYINKHLDLEYNFQLQQYQHQMTIYEQEHGSISSDDNKKRKNKNDQTPSPPQYPIRQNVDLNSSYIDFVHGLRNFSSYVTQQYAEIGVIQDNAMIPMNTTPSSFEGHHEGADSDMKTLLQLDDKNSNDNKSQTRNNRNNNNNNNLNYIFLRLKQIQQNKDLTYDLALFTGEFLTTLLSQYNFTKRTEDPYVLEHVTLQYGSNNSGNSIVPITALVLTRVMTLRESLCLGGGATRHPDNIQNDEPELTQDYGGEEQDPNDKIESQPSPVKKVPVQNAITKALKQVDSASRMGISVSKITGTIPPVPLDGKQMQYQAESVLQGNRVAALKSNLIANLDRGYVNQNDLSTLKRFVYTIAGDLVSSSSSNPPQQQPKD